MAPTGLRGPTCADSTKNVPLRPGELVLRAARRESPCPESSTTKAPFSSLLLRVLKRFLQEAVPAEFQVEDSSTAWSLKAVVFLDFVPVSVEARAFPDDDACLGFESVRIRPTEQNNIVKFYALVSLVQIFLQSHGFNVKGPSCSLPDFVDDFPEEEDVDETELWLSRLQPLLEGALGLASNPKQSAAAAREEAAQALARLSESGPPACNVALAQAFAERSTEVARVLLPKDSNAVDSANLATAYPLASALYLASLCPEAGEILAGSNISARIRNGGGLGQLKPLSATPERGLLARQVAKALRSISDIRHLALARANFPAQSRTAKEEQYAETLKRAPVGKGPLSSSCSSSIATTYVETFPRDSFLSAGLDSEADD